MNDLKSNESKTLPLNRATVLVIESSDESATSLRKEIESQGVRVVVAKKFTEATIMMQKQKFCSLVINKEVDGSESYDFIMRIRKTLISENKATPIILVGEKFEAGDFEKLGKSINAAVLYPLRDGLLSMNVKKFCIQVDN